MAPCSTFPYRILSTLPSRPSERKVISMAREKGKHLTKENREVIEDGINQSASARKIAKRLDVSPSTVTREVKNHRTLKSRKLLKNRPSNCAHYRDCQYSGAACDGCTTHLTTCKACRTRNCAERCPDFERKQCSVTQRWPYVCPQDCAKRAYCHFPKYRYDAADADALYRNGLSESRTGICADAEGLEAMNGIVVPLVKQGQSLEAIWATHAEELPVTVRTAYNYQEKGVLGVAALDMPRKVRLLPKRHVARTERTRVDRAGRTFDDFRKLPLEDQARVVQGDSVEGYGHNEHDILTLKLVSLKFQFHLYKKHADPAATVRWLDVIETTLGSPEAFEALFGVQLVDRGVEFDDWAGMERSCLVPGARRCRVFYCDAMNSNQKSPAERMHMRLRRILPKGRSDFDKLSVWDVAVCCSHVNSYPIPSLAGRCPLEVASGAIPATLLEELGIERIPPDEVILKPYLMAHAVEQ